VVRSADDAALWLAATTGTASAFAAIFDRHRAAVFRKAYARVGTPEDAEDVVAIVFLEAWRKRSRVRIVEGSVLPWLLTTTTYICLNHARGHRRHRVALSKLGPPSTYPDHSDLVHDEIERIERAIRLATAMASLPARDQVILELCVVDELPLADVAALMEIPIGTLKSRLSRARGKLRVDLSDLRQGPLSVEGGAA
jgi:RNA polymerase sigma factor (sigma-70 family)